MARFKPFNSFNLSAISHQHIVKHGVNTLLFALFLGLSTHTILNTFYGEQAPLSNIQSANDSMGIAPITPITPSWFSSAASNANSSLWRLVGTVVAGKRSYALLQTNEERALLLRIGQSLPDGSQLLSVQHKSATLINNGTETLLTLAEVDPNNTAMDITENSMPPEPSQPNLETSIQDTQQQAAEQAIAQAQMESAQAMRVETLKQQAESHRLMMEQQIKMSLQAAQIAAQANMAAMGAANSNTSLAPNLPTKPSE
jgi:hypothetical protein